MGLEIIMMVSKTQINVLAENTQNERPRQTSQKKTQVQQTTPTPHPTKTLITHTSRNVRS